MRKVLYIYLQAIFLLTRIQPTMLTAKHQVLLSRTGGQFFTLYHPTVSKVHSFV